MLFDEKGMIKPFLDMLKERFSRALDYSDKTVAVRRYFFSNSFDGVLAVMGLSLGASIVPGTQASTVVFAGIGMSIAMLVSSISGIYLTESAETKRMIKELQESLLHDVRGTVIEKAGATGTLIASLVGGISTFALALTVLSPHIISMFYKEFEPVASYASTMIGLAILFILGLFLGRLSRISSLKAGIRMVGIGGVAALLILLIELLMV